MELDEKLTARKKQIESILVNFGADSTEGVEEILQEMDDIEITLKTLRKYKYTSYIMPEAAGFQQEGSCPVCLSSTDPNFKPYCSANCETHDNLLC